MDLFFCSPQLDTISNTRSQIKIKIPFFERDKNLTLSLLHTQLKVLPLIKEALYSNKRAMVFVALRQVDPKDLKLPGFVNRITHLSSLLDML